MAVILCLETSYSVCSVAIVKGGEIFVRESADEYRHAELISELIRSCMEDAGIGFKLLDAVAISNGPGSYTGLRIGASTAKGICSGLKIPLIAIDTLKSLALAVYSKFPGHKGKVWPMVDARRMEVYHSIYTFGGTVFSDTTNGILNESGFIPAGVDRDTLLCGDGAKKAEEVLGLKNTGIVQHAVHLCAPSLKAFEDRKFEDTAMYQPNYLKPANITVSSSR